MIQSLPAVGGSLLYRCSDVHDPPIHLIHHHYTSGFMSFLLLKSTLQLTLAPLWCQGRRLTSHLSFPWRIIPHYSLLMPCLGGGGQISAPEGLLQDTHALSHYCHLSFSHTQRYTDSQRMRVVFKVDQKPTGL